MLYSNSKNRVGTVEYKIIPILASVDKIIYGDNSFYTYGGISFYTNEGKRFDNEHESPYDLFFVPQKNRSG